MYGRLFGRDDLVFDVLVVVGPPARGTQAVHVVLDIVVAELTYLERVVSIVAPRRKMQGREANLVAARTRLEALVSEVELLDAEGAGLLFVIVEYEGVLLHGLRHGVCV